MGALSLSAFPLPRKIGRKGSSPCFFIQITHTDSVCLVVRFFPPPYNMSPKNSQQTMVRLLVKISKRNDDENIGNEEAQTCVVDVSNGLDHVMKQLSSHFGFDHRDNDASSLATSSSSFSRGGHGHTVIQSLGLCIYKSGHYIGTSKITDASDLQQDDVVVAKCIVTGEHREKDNGEMTTSATTTTTTNTIVMPDFKGRISNKRSRSRSIGHGRPLKKNYSKYEVGTMIYKYFGSDSGGEEGDDDDDDGVSGWYLGEIVSIEDGLYCIEYEDGDSETIPLDDTEMDLIVENHKTYLENKRIMVDARSTTTAITKSKRRSKLLPRNRKNGGNGDSRNRSGKNRIDNNGDNGNKRKKRFNFFNTAPLTDAQRSTLRGREIDLNQFLSFLSDNGIGCSNWYLTSTVTSLIQGRGIYYHQWAETFYPSSSATIDLGTDFRELLQEVENHAKPYGKDITKGTLYRAPLLRMESYQYHVYKEAMKNNRMEADEVVEVEEVPSSTYTGEIVEI